MITKLKQRIADRLFPDWREDKLITSMLAHQARLRADPERQALNRRINRQLRKELAIGLLVSTCALLGVLLGCVCCLGHVPVLTAVASPLVQRVAGVIVGSAVVALLLIGRG